jgi:hypothetical protein
MPYVPLFVPLPRVLGPLPDYIKPPRPAALPWSLPSGVAHTPHTTPSISHLPHWNSMAMFKVQPGRSFHSVQVGRVVPVQQQLLADGVLL